MNLKEIFKLVKNLLKTKKSSTDDGDDGRTEHTGRTIPVPDTDIQDDILEEKWVVDLDEKLKSLSNIDTEEQQKGDISREEFDR